MNEVYPEAATPTLPSPACGGGLGGYGAALTGVNAFR